jgi:hypothetical protein
MPEEISATVLLSLDEEARDTIRKPAPRWDTEATLRLAQIVGLLIAGCWAYYIYATFQKESNELALKAGKAHLRESELALQKTQLEIQKSAIEVNRLGQAPVNTTERLRVDALTGSDAYLVTYDYTFTNVGNARVTISPVMPEAFLAHAPAASADTVVNDVGDPGPFHWQVLSRRGFIAPDQWRKEVKVINGTDEALAEQGDGGTGTMNAGEALDGNITVLVHGKPTDFIGFRIRYAVTPDSKNAGSNLERLRSFSPLGVISEKKGSK